jgi:hypothetical protein
VPFQRADCGEELLTDLRIDPSLTGALADLLLLRGQLAPPMATSWRSPGVDA